MLRNLFKKPSMHKNIGVGESVLEMEEISDVEASSVVGGAGVSLVVNGQKYSVESGPFDETQLGVGIQTNSFSANASPL